MATVDCSSVSSFDYVGSITCDSYEIVCLRVKFTATSNYTYHKIYSCNNCDLRGSTESYTYTVAGYDTGYTAKRCSCNCDSNTDCYTAWGSTVYNGSYTYSLSAYNTSTYTGTYQSRGTNTCKNSCYCTISKLSGDTSWFKAYTPEFRCAAGSYGTASCYSYSPTGALADIYYRCTGCYVCPAIIDADTGRTIYTNSGLSTVAYGTSVAGTATTSSKCYWGAGTYYDSGGKITISSGTSYSTCGYDN